MTDVMVDIESWGTRPGAALRSIGACVFDPNGDAIGDTFYRNIDDFSCTMAGLMVDPNTEAWWARQSKEAQEALLVDQVPLDDALRSFSIWFESVGGERIWSHGANFDQPLLEAAYVAAGFPGAPWKFWDSRCTRTVYDLAQIDARKVAVARSGGVTHNALDDAKAQASAVQAAIKRLLSGRAAEQTGGAFT